jgi:hypothetical protein
MTAEKTEFHVEVNSGLLREVRPVGVPLDRPRHHRQRRIRKKWQKRWERETVAKALEFEHALHLIGSHVVARGDKQTE